MFRFLVPFVCFISLNLLADQGEIDQKSSLDAAASFSHRTDGAVERGEFWRIPGVMMGGEAEPVEKGSELNEVLLFGNLVLSATNMAHVKFGYHDGHDGVELEHLWFSHRPAEGVEMVVGKMSGAFSPLADWHSSMSVFSEAPLMADVFLGRSFIDTGGRAALRVDDLLIGAEIWNGDSWPTTSGKVAGDLYIYFGQDKGESKLLIGGWVMRANADLRGDDRYTGSHDHGNAGFTPSPLDTRFTGETTLGGINISIKYPLGDFVTLLLDGERIRVEPQGEVLDPVRLISMEGNYSGWLIQPAVAVGHHQFSARYEKLSLKNTLIGSAPQFLAMDAGLVNNRFNPSRSGVSWSWSINQQFTLRAEWIKDESQPQDSRRVVAGLVWKQKIWKSNPIDAH